eukprot:2900058-Heterocapsa_arctica.AAC.1
MSSPSQAAGPRWPYGDSPEGSLSTHHVESMSSMSDPDYESGDNGISAPSAYEFIQRDNEPSASLPSASALPEFMDQATMTMPIHIA